MAKINKNVKAKAKKALAKINAGGKTLKAKLQGRKPVGGGGDGGDGSKLLLHKTIPHRNSTSKKDKVRQKHKELMNKFQVIKKQRKEEIARSNRQKTAVIGDLKPLKDALPSLDELFALARDKDGIKTGMDECIAPNATKANLRQRIRRKKDKFIGQVTSYEALLNDPDFKKNPRDIISYHIKYKHGLISE